MDHFLKFIGGAVVVVALVAGLSLLFAFPTKWMVNYLFTPGAIVSLFGVAQISVWKALWLNMLCGTLFKGTTTAAK